MPINIETPDIQLTPYDQLCYATEVAFNALMKAAIENGLLAENAGVHLMYLPDQKATQDFKDACRNSLASLGVIVSPKG